MKIKLITSAGIDGTVVGPGKEVEVSRSVGLDLIARKRAISLEGPKEAKTITSEALNTEQSPRRGRPKKDGEAGEE